MDKIQVQIQGRSYLVIGAAFGEMLQRVRDIPGRAYLSAQKAWELPLALEEVQAALQPLRIVDDEQMLEAEIEEIRVAQARLLELKPTIEAQIQQLSSRVSTYAYHSKSRVKATMAHDSSLLYHALEYATLPVEQLTEPQMRTLFAALREVER